MYDTVKISCPYSEVEIYNKEAFKTDPDGYLQMGEKTYRNQNKEEIEQGIYLRHIEVMFTKGLSKSCEKRIYFEFSCSKLIFGNNYIECQESDFEDIVTKLQDTLGLMGIIISKDSIRNAKVDRLDVGKNINLSSISKSPLFCKTLISMLDKVPVSGAQTQDHKDFQNGGSAFYISTRDYCYTLYDKIYDLQRDGIFLSDYEQQYEKTPVGLVKHIKSEGIVNLLRVEFRMRNSAYIRKILIKKAINIPLTFQNIFKEDIAKALNMYAWDKFIAPYINSLSNARYRTKKFINECLNTNLPYLKTMAILGVQYLSQHANGLMSISDLKEKFPNYKKESLELISQTPVNKRTSINKALKSIEKSLEDNIPIRDS